MTVRIVDVRDLLCMCDDLSDAYVIVKIVDG